MVLQFVLLLWAAVYLANRVVTHRPSARGLTDQKLLDTALIVLLAIGATSSLYQLCRLRVYALLRDRNHWQNYLQMANGEDAFALRSAYAELDRVVPANAVVQYNPDSNLTTSMLIYSRYQQAAADPGCMTPFGGSAAECARVQTGLQAIFDPHAGGNPSSAEVNKICQWLHINVLLVNSLDPVWNRKDSWVWQDTPIIRNDFVRVYKCGSEL
jgi:hypothetical protein